MEAKNLLTVRRIIRGVTMEVSRISFLRSFLKVEGKGGHHPSADGIFLKGPEPDHVRFDPLILL